MPATAYEGNEPFLFISYAHADARLVLQILELLGRAGLRFWYDEGIYSGDDWRMKIEQRLVDSAGVLAFISAAAIGSKNCRNEIFFAEDTDKPLHLVRLDDAPYAHGLAMTLGHMNYVPFEGAAEPLVSRLMSDDDLQACKAVRTATHSFWRPQPATFGLWRTEGEEQAERAVLSSAWGPERPLYHTGEYPDGWAINSCIDHPTRGDERHFVHVRKEGAPTWLREIFLEPGCRYEVRLGYRVDGDPQRNASGTAIAQSVKASLYLPERVVPQYGGTVRGALHAAWPQPGPLAPDDELWASVRLYVRDAPVFLRFVPASAKLHNAGKLDGTTLGTQLFTPEGMYLGFNAFKGVLPSGDDFAGSITCTFETFSLQGDCTIEREAHTAGGAFAPGFLEAQPGDTITFRTTFANVSDTQLSNVCFKDVLAPSLVPVPGTTMVTNGAHHEGYLLKDDTLGTTGFNSGTCQHAGKATITYDVVAPTSDRPHNYFTQSRVYHDGGTRASMLLVHVDGTGADDPLLVPDPEHDPRYEAFLAQAPRGGWGPNRALFTMRHPAPYAALNSITDNNVLGDERGFVRIARKGAGGRFANRLQIVPGYLYEVYVAYDNAAAPNLGEAGVARDVRLRVSFPSRLEPLAWKRVSGTISSSSTNPPEVWAHSVIWAAQPVVLRAVPGSAKLYNARHQGTPLGDGIFSRQGALLGADALDGTIVCSDAAASGHVILLLSAEEA